MDTIPRHNALAPIAVFVVTFLSSHAGLAAQTGVPVHQEPRHRLVLDRAPVRVLDVQIVPGDTTLYHTHDSAILYVTISVSTTVSQALGGEWPASNPADRPKDDVTGTIEIDDQFFGAWRLTLQPGQASPWFRSSQPLVGVHVSGGEIEVQRRSGEPSALKASGEWFFGDPGTEYRIRSPGEQALELVLVQTR